MKKVDDLFILFINIERVVVGTLVSLFISRISCHQFIVKSCNKTLCIMNL